MFTLKYPHGSLRVLAAYNHWNIVITSISGAKARYFRSSYSPKFQFWFRFQGCTRFGDFLLNFKECQILSRIYIETAYSNFLWGLHAQFSGAPHNFRKRARPWVRNMEIYCVLSCQRLKSKNVRVRLRTSQLLTSCEVFSAPRNRAAKANRIYKWVNKKFLTMGIFFVHQHGATLFYKGPFPVF